MKYILLLLLFMIMISCDRSTPALPITYCSPENAYAPCENTEEICYKGSCISKDLECGENNDAPCKTGEECRRDETTREFSCVEGRCSRGNTDGYCVKEGQNCYAGVCKTPCSIDNLYGGCEDSSTSCFNGECIDKNNQCSAVNPNGLCQTGFKCSEQPDGQYLCVNLCSKDFVEGPCKEDDQVCVDGECLHSDNLCENKDNGECPSNKTCIENKCELSCSDIVPDGVCLTTEQICINGTCEYKCSVNHPVGYCSSEYAGCQEGECKLECGTGNNQEEDGYCDDNQWCDKGFCKDRCDIQHPTGNCKDENKWCNQGECVSLCNQDHKDDGICQDVNQRCIEGVCEDWCSSVYPSGLCEEGKVCENTQCVDAPCSAAFPTGYCSVENQKCVDNFCRDACSSTTPNGWCADGKYCYSNSCKFSTEIPCSEVNGTYCQNSTDECINNVCTLRLCDVGFDGRCEESGFICNTMTGQCEEAPMCSDYRPVMCKDGETPAVDDCEKIDDLVNFSTFGACCTTDEDCGAVDADNDGDIDITFSNDNRCIQDGNTEGAFCNKIGINTCSSDNDCNEPYPGYGNTQEYYCSSYSELWDYGDISFCERVKENCQRDSKTPGQACNEECGNSECGQGYYCIDGICTIGCDTIGDNQFCPIVNGKQLECSNYFAKKAYPGYPYSIHTNICRNTCSSNNDCPLPENECNSFFNYSSTSSDTPLFLTCGKKINGKSSGVECFDHLECSSGACLGLTTETNSGFCGTRPCAENEDCGNAGYCDHFLSLGSVYIGMCKDLAQGTQRKNDCTSTQDCPTETVTVNNITRQYKCLSYTDSDDVVRGVCGIPEIIGVPTDEGGPCSTQNRYCESNLCINQSLEVNKGVGSCRELCSQTSDCSTISVDGVLQNQICERIKFRLGTTINDNNRESYGGICLPFGTSSLDDCTTNLCQSSETCILNPVNDYSDPAKPWLFSVEYLCVSKNLNGNILGSNCGSDSDCQSNLCSVTTSKCSIACTTDAQCAGIGSETCNLGYPAIYDDNISNWVLGGVCE